MTKICKKCKQEKPLTDFGKKKSYKDRINNICKTCIKLESEKYRIKNKEKIIERRKISNIKRDTKNKEWNYPNEELKQYKLTHYKKCNKCNETISLNYFNRVGNTCKKCHTKITIQWRKENKTEKRKLRTNELQLKRYHENSSLICLKANTKRLKLTPEWYIEQFNKQNEKCAICNQKEIQINTKGEIKRLAIDHNHKTGKVRDLLCSNCNRALGHFKDDVEIIENAIKYLNKHS